MPRVGGCSIRRINVLFKLPSGASSRQSCTAALFGHLRRLHLPKWDAVPRAAPTKGFRLSLAAVGVPIWEQRSGRACFHPGIQVYCQGCDASPGRSEHDATIDPYWRADRNGFRGWRCGQPELGRCGAEPQYPGAAGGAVKITTAEWATPNGTVISRQGIVPDMAVEPSGKPEDDRALARAAMRLKIAHPVSGRVNSPKNNDTGQVVGL